MTAKERRRAAAPIDHVTRERALTTTRHEVLGHNSVVRLLEAEGWRPQADQWRRVPAERAELPADALHWLEWWNRGADVLVLYVQRSDAKSLAVCTVFVPVTGTRAQTAIKRKRIESARSALERRVLEQEARVNAMARRANLERVIGNAREFRIGAWHVEYRPEREDGERWTVHHGGGYFGGFPSPVDAAAEAMAHDDTLRVGMVEVVR